MNKIISVFLVLCFTSLTYSQSLSGKKILPKGLRISNQLEYAFDKKRDLEILENWFQMDYRNGGFFSGIRIETFQPNDPDPSVSRGKSVFGDVAFKYVGYKIGSSKEYMEVTAGNFYQLLGRGMVLKSYEDRNIRVDNNLFGLRIKGRYNNLQLTALTGMGANFNNDRKDILHAFDAEYKFIKNLKMGGTFAINTPSGNASKSSLTSVRLLPSFSNFDFYFEYALKFNDDQKQLLNANSYVGRGIYANANFYYDNLSLSGEYKYYDNFAFTSADGTVNYNTPPSLRQDYPFTLINRHPSPLNANNEQGYQLSANYNLNDNFFQANFGITNTLDESSFINTGNLKVATQFKEIFFEWERDWNESMFSLIGIQYNEELSSATKNLTPVFEGRYYFNKINTLKITFEHQNTENTISGENYFTEFLLLEYLRSPKLSVAIATEMKTFQPEENRTVRKLWGFVRLGYKLGMHSDISLLVGSRQAGNICVGGVCRYEPEFNGVELKLLTRL